MSESNQPADLGPFEARLAELLPHALEVNRDDVLFEAGRQAANRDHKRALRKWHALSGVLVCFVIGQWAWLPRTVEPWGQTAPIAEHTPTDQTPETPPTQPQPPVAEPQSPSLAHAQVVPQAESIPRDAATSSEKPFSIWGQLFATTNAPLAWQRQLSVGSSRKGSLPMSTLMPQGGALPSHLETPLKTMRREWAPEIINQ